MKVIYYKRNWLGLKKYNHGTVVFEKAKTWIGQYAFMTRHYKLLYIDNGTDHLDRIDDCQVVEKLSQ